jgi:uncharacterized membrane protein
MRHDVTTPERLGELSDEMLAVIFTHLVLELKASDDPKLTAILSLWTTQVRYVDSSAPGISPRCFNNLIK